MDVTELDEFFNVISIDAEVQTEANASNFSLIQNHHELVHMAAVASFSTALSQLSALRNSLEAALAHDPHDRAALSSLSLEDDLCSDSDLWVDDWMLNSTLANLTVVRNNWTHCAINMEDRCSDHFEGEVDEIAGDVHCILLGHDTAGMDHLDVWLSHYILRHIREDVQQIWDELLDET